MNILELLNSTYRLGERRRPSYVFSKKPFGHIYAFNKSVIYKPKNSIVEISMYITAVTELDKTAHKVQVALQGVNISEHSKEELFSIIRMQSKYKELTDIELMAKIYSELDIINGKYIMQASNDKFVLIDKRIPMTTQVRVKCSCFTGDTKVLMANGEYKTLKELEDKTNFKIIAYNKENDKFEIANAIICELKEKDAKIIKITLSDGTVIRTTPEHRFLDSNNKWIEAINLKEGNVLKSTKKINTEHLQKHHNNESYYTYIYLDPRKKGNYIYKDIHFDYEPFYVGIGSGIKRDIDNNKCYTKMSEIYESGNNPILIKQSTFVDKHVALQLKKKLIDKIGLDTEEGTLVNRKIIEDTFITKNNKQGYKVASIEHIQEKEDVYCITTEGLGNFLVATNINSGVVVENCADYYYTFGYYNAEHKVHIGMKPPKYIPYRKITKNDADFRPSRNPNRHPGVCKHLLLFIALLMNGRVINPSNQLIDTFTENKKRLDIYSRRDMTTMLEKVNKELKLQNQKIKEQRQAIKDYDAKDKKGNK